MPSWGKFATLALAAEAVCASESWVSEWGTLKAPKLPSYLENNPMPQGKPWGLRSAKNTNAYSDCPNTGVTRSYQWTVTQTTCAPDGVPVTCNLINGQYPGPLIEANWGDWIQVEVTNLIPDEGTSIHWHGLLQKDTPWMDGVPGNNQCPIAPNGTFTYRFRADLYGTSWYHSHWSAQYASGVVGPIVIYGPKNVDYDYDLGPVTITDWYHEYYTENVQLTLANPITGHPAPPLANNNLINGKTNNGGQIATFSVTSGSTYRMRLINTGASSVQRFSIDGYNVTIFANDFVPVVPYSTDVVTLAIGQRTDILFTASGSSTDAVWMRAYRPPLCGPSAGNELVLAAIYYEDADTSVQPTTQPGPNAELNAPFACGNDPLALTVPYYPMTPPEPDVTENIALNFTSNGTALLWYFNGQTFRIDYNDPMLLETKLGNAADFPAIRNAHIYPGSVNSIRMVIENPITQPHPMHLHGHNIWILQEGPCASIPGSPPPPPPPPSTTTSEVVPPPYTTSTTTIVPPPYTTTSSVVSPPPYSTSSSSSSSSNSTSPPPYSTSSSTSSPPAYSTSTPPAYTKRDDSEAKVRYSFDFNPQMKRQATPPANSCWDGSIVNPENPQRRDVHMLNPQSYIVIQWVQDNPGVWPLHCHIAWHLSAGMAYMVVENPAAVESEMQIPSIMAQTCRDWATYSQTNVVDQIDDGI